MVIDLGTDWAPAEAQPQWRPPRRHRLLAGLLAGLLLASTLAGSAAPAASWRLVASAPASYGDSFLLSGNRLIVARAPGPTQPGTRLNAYQLPSGRPLWQTPMPSGLSLISADNPDVLLVELDSGSETKPPALAALDLGTGRVLWRLAEATISGYPGPASQHAVLVTTTVEGTDELRLTDAHTGRPIWSLALPPDATVHPLSPERLALWTATGLTRVLDERTGRLLVTGQLPTEQSTVAPLLGPNLYAIGGQLLDLYPLPDGTMITAYGLDTLAFHWQFRLPDQVQFAADCGPVLCLDGDHGLTTIDPVSTQRRWSSSRWALAAAYGPLSMVTNLEPTGPQQRVLVDTATGRVVLDLRGWWPLHEIVPGRPTLLIAPQQSPNPGAWLGTLAPDTTRASPMAFLPGANADNCALDQSAGTYLACTDRGGPVHVWMNRPLPR
jgi:hypothetical protein